MSLKNVLIANGYTMNDLWYKLQKKGCKIKRMDFNKAGNARRPGNRPWWNTIVICLDEMGVDW